MAILLYFVQNLLKKRNIETIEYNLEVDIIMIDTVGVIGKIQ
jgi:hypothetical protein